MSRKLDITDKIYGRLQAIVIDWYKTNQGKGTYWFCQCECNRIVSVSIKNLQRGNTQSCGCLAKELSSKRRKNKRLDITDQIYGRLLVLIMDWYRTNLTGRTYWWCQCEDNNIVSVRFDSLKNGSVQSCGCLRRDKVSEKEDITNQLFGRWKAIDINKEKTKEIGRTYWNVICVNDGNKGCVDIAELKRGNSKSCGCLQKEISKKNNSGKNSQWWKGGITPFYQMLRTHKIYVNFVQTILKKANYICQLSGEKSKGDLQVHHIKGFAKILEENNITTLEEAENCKELWNEDNVIVLKEKYHMGQKIDNPNAFHRVYGKYNFTEQDFHEWFNKFKIDFKEGVS